MSSLIGIGISDGDEDLGRDLIAQLIEAAGPGKAPGSLEASISM
jgi:hypothetical protein